MHSICFAAASPLERCQRRQSGRSQETGLNGAQHRRADHQFQVHTSHSGKLDPVPSASPAGTPLTHSICYAPLQNSSLAQPLAATACTQRRQSLELYPETPTQRFLLKRTATNFVKQKIYTKATIYEHYLVVLFLAENGANEQLLDCSN